MHKKKIVLSENPIVQDLRTRLRSAISSISTKHYISQSEILEQAFSIIAKDYLSEWSVETAMVAICKVAIEVRKKIVEMPMVLSCSEKLALGGLMKSLIPLFRVIHAHNDAWMQNIARPDGSPYELPIFKSATGEVQLTLGHLSLIQNKFLTAALPFFSKDEFDEIQWSRKRSPASNEERPPTSD